MKKHSAFSLKTWLRAGLFTAFAASFSLNLQAQTAPVKQWNKTFGGSGDDLLYSLQQTTDGGYILGGYSCSGISGDKSQACQGSQGYDDYWIVKLDASGNKIWDKTFGGSIYDRLFSLEQTLDGGYILGGGSYSGIGGDKSQACKGLWDYWVIKLDASGNKTWDKTFGGSENDLLNSLQQTSDGGYILGGSSRSEDGDKSQASKGLTDYWVVKLDGSGNKTWDKTFGGSVEDVFNSLQQTSDGGYILGGQSWSPISGDKSQANQGTNNSDDYWVVKLDANGNKIWDKTFGGNDVDRLYSLQQTSDGGYILGGYSNSGLSGDKSQASKGSIDYWIIKLDTNANKTWDKTLGGSNSDIFTSLQQTSDGGYILGGSSESSVGGDKSQACQGVVDYWVIKLDVSGNKTWDKTIGGSDNDNLSSLQQTSDGGYILGGRSASGISGDKSQASKGDIWDYWVIKLSASPTGIKENEATFPVSIHPNPNNGKFNLQLSKLTVPAAEVTVSDLMGRVVMQQELPVTDQEISQELVLPSVKGIYLMQIKAEEQTTTRKIVVE